MTAESRAGGLAEDSALRALADALDVRLGLALPPWDPSTIARRLRHRIRERAFGSVVEYAEYLIHGATETAWDELAETLTANESRIFEAPQDFLPLFELAAGARWGRYARGAAEEPFRALSAGSGTGEEAYSIGMALAEVTQGAPAFRFEVVGVDLSRQAVAAAREGAYAESRFGSLPSELGERHFVRAGDGRVPIGELRRRVRFGRV
ncbi:MAG TPA: CheR family methyltransferase, partial [Candidatus Eisenbacteria bacterium]